MKRADWVLVALAMVLVLFFVGIFWGPTPTGPGYFGPGTDLLTPSE